MLKGNFEGFFFLGGGGVSGASNPPNLPLLPVGFAVASNPKP